MRVPLTSRAAWAVLALAVPLLAACGGGAESACSVPVREELDPKSLLHVIDPATAVYTTDPPTSGPHLGAPGPTGLVAAPMLPAIQVSILERGDVLVQYRDPADLPALQGLVAERVVVAPQPSLKTRVVVTAWTYKLSCDGIDTKAITSFAKAHAGKSQGH